MPSKKKSKQPEYRLLIIPQTDERTEKPTTLFVIETAQAFAAFRYELSVREKIEGRSITFTILGLKTPGLSLPSSGRARFTREFGELKGAYEITVVGLDGRATSFPIAVGKGRVEIRGKITGAGLTVTTDPAAFAAG